MSLRAVGDPKPVDGRASCFAAGVDPQKKRINQDEGKNADGSSSSSSSRSCCNCCSCNCQLSSLWSLSSFHRYGDPIRSIDFNEAWPAICHSKSMKPNKYIDGVTIKQEGCPTK